ncbi:MAG: prepilin-type N-terminal cleavage/methylation domain-containing protein [Gammaproteobacteria bacterium]|nr:prepilin-type N-terminal cleavage/methylation domain-containing protein [Gammaproteobacteria bacterium]
MKERGFSFSEVLLALLLVTSISLALLKQQWKMHRWMIEMQRQDRAWLDLSNERERSQQQGFSLIEWMIGLALSLSLITACIQQYAHVQRHFHWLVVKMAKASGLPITLDLLRSRGHQAGFTPCLSLPALQTLDRRSGHALQMLSFSDHDSKITFRRMHEVHVPVAKIRGQRRVTLAASMTWHTGMPLIIADCQHAEVHAAYQISQRSINLAHALRFDYHAPIYIGAWVEESFWIKNHTLYYQQQHAEALMSDIVAWRWQLAPHLLHLDIDRGDKDSIPLDIRLHA